MEQNENERMSANKKSVQSAFEKTLNRHGFGLQYAVLKEAIEQCSRPGHGGNFWRYEIFECPVEVNGSPIHIDFILKRSVSERLAFVLLAECKRVNPAVSNWCFIKIPPRTRTTTLDLLYLEKAVLGEEGLFAYSERWLPSEDSDIYHIAMDIKSGEKGDEKGSGRGAIEDAVNQLSRGMNGFITLLGRNQNLIGFNQSIILLPVIFTNAKLWAAEGVDLGMTDRTTGNVDFREASLSQKDWIAYECNLSPGLKHEKSPPPIESELRKYIRQEFTRTIVVVNAGSVGTFLQWAYSKIEKYD